jgi:hypothetical protein
MGLRRAIIAAAVLSAPACLFPSLDGLTSGDASIDVANDAPTDAASKETSTDAAPDVIATDASDAGDGGFCATLSPKPLFCQDFDEGPVATGWDNINANVGTVDVSSAQSVSPPKSLLATFPSATNLYVFDYVAKNFKAPIGNATLEFDLDMDTIDPSQQYTKVVEFVFSGNTPNYILYLQITDSTTLSMVYQQPTSDGGVTFGDYGGTQLPPLGKWTHVKIDLFKSTTDSSTAAADLFIDGNVALTSFPLGSSAAFGDVALRIGLPGVSVPTTAWKVYIDNVTFDEK